MKKLIFLTLCLIIFLSACATKKLEKNNYKADEPYMLGMVYDYDNKPVENARIYVNEEHISSTDIQGRFILNYKLSEQNDYSLKIEKVGFESVETAFLFDPVNVLYIRMINTQQLLRLAEDAMNAHNYTESEILLKRALALSPERDDIKYLLSIALYKQNKLQEAKDALAQIKSQGISEIYVEKLKVMIGK